MLSAVIKRYPTFSTENHATKIRFFAWFLHAHEQKDSFTVGDIRRCYQQLHLDEPASINSFLNAMLSRKPKELLRDASGAYRLERRIREQFDQKLGQRETTVEVDQLLAGLSNRIAVPAQRDYLDEAMICFRNGAFRASIVMTWNLAFDHLCDRVIATHLAAFNAQLALSYPKEKQVQKRDDLTELKEFQVLQVCRSANLTSPNIHKILLEKLSRRNIAAHPSGVSVSRLTAEEFIKDLLENFVLQFQ